MNYLFIQIIIIDIDYNNNINNKVGKYKIYNNISQI